MKGFIFAIIVVSFVNVVYSQPKKNKKVLAPSILSIKLKHNKPSVFITFNKFENIRPTELNQTDNMVWLKMNNNANQ